MSPYPRPWLAALASLAFPGIGQLYAGRPLRALVIAVVALLSLPAFVGLLFVAPSVVTGVAVWLVPIGFRVWLVWDAYRVAGAWPADQPRPAFSRWPVVLASAAVLSVCSYAAYTWQRGVIQAFHIPSDSMGPTLQVGDYLYVDKRAAARVAQRGVPVVYESVEDPGLLVIKRVVGMPGDTLAMRGGELLRNGIAVREPYVVRPHGTRHEESLQRTKMAAWQRTHLARPDTGGYAPDLSDWGPIVVPADSLMTLGDDRDASYDGRYTGPVPIGNIRGRPRVIYWSMGDSGVRLSRVGREID